MTTAIATTVRPLTTAISGRKIDLKIEALDVKIAENDAKMEDKIGEVDKKIGALDVKVEEKIGAVDKKIGEVDKKLEPESSKRRQGTRRRQWRR
eukprot:SAG11_NODE_1712_length_4400_cov_23.295048_3_plen_94_part_00